MEIQGIRTPLGNQLKRDFTDLVAHERNYIALLANLEKTFGTGRVPTFFSTLPMWGGVQNNFFLSEPEWEGFAPTNTDIAGMQAQPKTASSVAGGKMYPSAYRMPSEAISEYFVKTLESDAATAGYVMKVAGGIRDGLYAKLEEDIFPTSNELAPTVAGGVLGEQREDKVLAFGHVFQSGYVGNSATPDNSQFSYMGINLNDPKWTNFKAVVVAPFGVPSTPQLRRRLYYPMADQLSKGDLVLTDWDTYDYTLTEAEGKVQLKNMETFKYGGMHRILADGTIVAMINNLQKLFQNTNKHRLYWVDKRDFFWNFTGIKSTTLDELPYNPGYYNTQAVCYAMHLIEKGRWGGLAWDLQLS